MSLLQLAIGQIVFARNYTIELIDNVPGDDWFRQPPGGVSHVAWQVGHLTYAEYRLALWRIRGVQSQDGEFLPESYPPLFGSGSIPDADPAPYPAPSEIRTSFDRVHERVLRELHSLQESEMEQPVLHPHPYAKSKMEALLWCARHEMLHAGQIGLLRRQLGYPPL